jgi:ectoine hydroxylase-related dioxygenase (phytanoyl-CoA dioxygenase family)
MYLNTPYKISYDTQKFPFREIVSDMLEINDTRLEDLHLLEQYELLSREQDQKTKWHKRYYDKFHTNFLPTYIELVKSIKESFNYQELIYQQIPTFRVQLGNGNVAVGEWHKDKTYEHGTTEVNFWMPFVNTNPFNSIWAESSEDKGDYKPYLVNYSEILVFSGANLLHGNKKNESNETRVSVDFRLVDPNKFVPNSKGSINMNSVFDIGGYFEKL